MNRCVLIAVIVLQIFQPAFAADDGCFKSADAWKFQAYQPARSMLRGGVGSRVRLELIDQAGKMTSVELIRAKFSTANG